MTATDLQIAQAGFFARHKFAIGLLLYAAGAAADAYFTLGGTGGNLELEGNPIMRWIMAHFGHAAGLVGQKTVIGAGSAFIAVFGARAIKNREQWIEKVPSTRWARAWMRRKDRSWIAYLPLYIVAAAQGLAAASWVVLGILY